MADEVSSDVQFLIDQLNQIKNNKNEMIINYEKIIINGENILTKKETEKQPTIEIHKQNDDMSYRTLLMIDPDAPSSSNPITGPFIHWILANFQQIDGSDGQHICEYRSPGPRPSTGRHRYIFLLYQSDEQVRQGKKFDEIEQRRKFQLENFVVENQLKLVDVTLFHVDSN